MFEWVVGKILSVTFLQPIIGGILTAQKQKLDAAGSHEARVAELAAKDIELDKREAELNASIVIAEQGNWLTRLPRPLMGISVAILTAKLLVWDLALGQWTHGSTDKLSSQTYWLLTTIVVSYFGTRSVERVATKIWGKR